MINKVSKNICRYFQQPFTIFAIFYSPFINKYYLINTHTQFCSTKICRRAHNVANRIIHKLLTHILFTSLRMIKINNQFSVTGLIIKDFLNYLLISSFKYMFLQWNILYKTPEQATDFYPTTNNNIGLRPIKINQTAQQVLVLFHKFTKFDFIGTRTSGSLLQIHRRDRL